MKTRIYAAPAQRNNRLMHGDDTDHDKDPGSGYDLNHKDLHATFTRGVSRVKEQSINSGEGL